MSNSWNFTDTTITGPNNQAYNLVLDANNRLAGFKPQNQSGEWFDRFLRGENNNNGIFTDRGNFDIDSMEPGSTNVPLDYFAPDKNAISRLNEKLNQGFSLTPGEGRSVIGFESIPGQTFGRERSGYMGGTSRGAAGTSWDALSIKPESGNYQVPLYGPPGSMSAQTASSTPAEPIQPIDSDSARDRMNRITTWERGDKPRTPYPVFDRYNPLANANEVKQEIESERQKRAETFAKVLEKTKRDNRYIGSYVST
jgi:hypothetical protein